MSVGRWVVGLVGWSVGRLVGQLVGWSVVWLVGRLVGQSVGRSVCRGHQVDKVRKRAFLLRPSFRNWYWPCIRPCSTFYSRTRNSTPCCVGRCVRLSVSFLNSEQFLRYCSGPTVCNWIAVYPALLTHADDRTDQWTDEPTEDRPMDGRTKPLIELRVRN